MIAVADVADAVVKALHRADLARETIEIGGLDNPTEREVAALYAELCGRPAKVRAVPPFALRMLSPAIAPFHAGVGRLLRLPLQLAGGRICGSIPLRRCRGWASSLSVSATLRKAD
jgi:uncharacterized protein YbjT (DUF2867 family)